jgi:hypothetical protein
LEALWCTLRLPGTLQGGRVQCTLYTVGTPSEAIFRFDTANPFGNTLKFSVLTPLATQSFEPNPVWQRYKYSMETDSI